MRSLNNRVSCSVQTERTTKSLCTFKLFSCELIDVQKVAIAVPMPSRKPSAVLQESRADHSMKKCSVLNNLRTTLLVSHRIYYSNYIPLSACEVGRRNLY
jgi:hypothetical protein